MIQMQVARRSRTTAPARELAGASTPAPRASVSGVAVFDALLPVLLSLAALLGAFVLLAQLPDATVAHGIGRRVRLPAPDLVCALGALALADALSIEFLDARGHFGV